MLQQLTSEQWLQPFPFEEWVLYARVPCLPHCPGLATFLPSVFPEWVHRTVTSSTVCQWYDSSLLVRFVSQVARQMGANIPWSDGPSFCHIYCGARSRHIYFYYEASSRHIYCGASSPHIYIYYEASSRHIYCEAIYRQLLELLSWQHIFSGSCMQGQRGPVIKH